MIWIIFALLTAATLAMVLLPLLRRRPEAATRAEYDLTVYRDQLAEVDRELARGTLSPDQAEAARTEVQRRILAAADKGQGVQSRAGRRAPLAAAVAVLVPAAGFGIYLSLGSPMLPDQPYSGRAAGIAEMQDQAKLIETMIASLAAKLEKNPNDGKGWAMLGRSLRVTGQADKAREAYRRAARLMPGDTGVRLEYASMLLDDVPQGAMLPPEFVGVMREVAAVDPRNVDALYFLGLSEAQTGNAAKARDYWSRLVAVLPEGEDRTEIKRQLEALK
ncbi:c-type cytochrome biogenesis protein CcmI [Magnetospirillum sp. UT-4]|uniref:c-type cytochrome biogenesis protein CcmI n=1 Tax=Magnetospirillum sp. UT-4 TaxID=2681467 RepID=UPI00137EE7CF|nr:c-type cytochrome biogenesis protein CcmI [Magnetospirillum sp. UT-4]CAA7617153.1 Cytochrome c-type biogenesis protein CycH [Magnetospirillum sp. UT-4]